MITGQMGTGLIGTGLIGTGLINKCSARLSGFLVSHTMQGRISNVTQLLRKLQ